MAQSYFYYVSSGGFLSCATWILEFPSEAHSFVCHLRAIAVRNSTRFCVRGVMSPVRSFVTINEIVTRQWTLLNVNLRIACSTKWFCTTIRQKWLTLRPTLSLSPVLELEHHCHDNFLGKCLNFSFEDFYFTLKRVAILGFPYISRTSCVRLIQVFSLMLHSKRDA